MNNENNNSNGVSNNCIPNTDIKENDVLHSNNDNNNNNNNIDEEDGNINNITDNGSPKCSLSQEHNGQSSHDTAPNDSDSDIHTNGRRTSSSTECSNTNINVNESCDSDNNNNICIPTINDPMITSSESADSITGRNAHRKTRPLSSSDESDSGIQKKNFLTIEPAVDAPGDECDETQDELRDEMPVINEPLKPSFGKIVEFDRSDTSSNSEDDSLRSRR